MKTLKDIEMVIRLPPSCNRQDVQLLHNCILPVFLRSRTGRVYKARIINDIKDIVMERKDNNAEKHWISLRVKPEEYAQIQRHFASSTCRKLSDYARKVLMNKPVVIRYRNQSADEFLSGMIQLKKELNSIGNNFNQAVKVLHTLRQIEEFKRWLLTYESDRQNLLEKVDEIKYKVQKIYEKWPQE